MEQSNVECSKKRGMKVEQWNNGPHFRSNVPLVYCSNALIFAAQKFGGAGGIELHW